MPPILSNAWEERRVDGYDILVIGSGYGGAITAARLAQSDLDPKPTVCILERGKEWPVGTFPDTLSEFTAHTFNDVLNPLGLHEFSVHKDITVVKGSGLGGTSLINANVAIRPDPSVFSDWPVAIRQAAQMEEGHDGSLWNYYTRVEQTLDVSQHPEGNRLRKVEALGKRAAQIGQTATLLKIAVNFDKEGVEVFGGEAGAIVKHKCIDCGDCVTGCNVGAKNTLYMNYLPLAKKGGAHIFTQVEADYLEKAPDGMWLVHVIRRENAFSFTRTTVKARMVILAAGSLGSTKLLLRSEQQGLTVSPAVGMRFNGNGDFFGLAYNGDQITDVLGWGNHPDDPIAKVVRSGPTITSVVHYKQSPNLREHYVIEDVSVPRALRDAAAKAFRILKGQDTDTGLLDKAREVRRQLKDIGGADPEGALNSSIVYLCTAMDDAGGTMHLDALGKLGISWPGVGGQAIFGLINKECFEHAKALGASFIENPLWKISPWQTLLTAHPLGGCAMGEDGSDGACDHLGRVFTGKGTGVHQGLYVADGAIIRSSLAVNPFLTIGALAERIAGHIIAARKGLPAEEAGEVFAVPPQPREITSVMAIDLPEEQLENIFSGAETLPLERLINKGQHTIDIWNRSVYNDRFWKGFFPRGQALNMFSSLFFAGFRKRFFQAAEGIQGITSDSDGRINARNTLEEVLITEKKGDLDKGRYILLRYPDPPWQTFYDVFKVVSEDLMIGRVYLGAFPHGVRIMTFPMVRRYDFDHMTVDDFRTLFNDYGVQPDQKTLEGSWQMRTIANSNHSGAVARLTYTTKPSGRLEARYQFLDILEGESRIHFTGEQLEMLDFTPLHDEIRMLSSDYLVGKWTTGNIRAFGPFASNSFGLIHTEIAADGSKRFSFYYRLQRSPAAVAPLVFSAGPRMLAEPVSAGITFDEVMTGGYYGGEKITNDPDIEALPQRLGKGIECSFSVTISMRDLDGFIADPNHRADIRGSIRFGEFAGGKNVTYPVDADPRYTFFEYLRENPETKEHEMRYSLRFAAGNGKSYVFSGRKFLQRDEGGGVQEIMHDYTTLYCRVYELTPEGEPGKETGIALLKFKTFEDVASVASLLKFLGSFEVTGTSNPFKKIQAGNKFTLFTLQAIFREYELT